MAKKEKKGSGCPLTTKQIEPVGDLAFPIPPGKPFASLKGDADQMQSGAELAEANLVFDASKGTLSSTVLGMLSGGKGGLKVSPLWTVSEDRQSMTLTVYPKDCFGDKITDDYIRKSLPENVQRLDNDAIDAAIAEAQEKEGPVEGVVIGSGSLARNGLDGRLDLTFNRRTDIGEVQQDGSMDFRERGGIVCVAEGEDVATLVPPTLGRPGFDVLGAEIRAEDGQPVIVKVGVGIVASEDEGGVIHYKSEIPGMVSYIDGTLSISDVLELNSDVDLSSGNVHAKKGSLHIKGTVTTGATVTAQEHVIVDVVVENATIQAGGDVTVGGGVLMEEGGVIKAAGTVTAKFMRNATIRAGGDVIVDVDFVNCDIRAGGRIVAGSDKGIVNGGTYVSAGMDVAELGSDVGSPTSVTLKLPENEEEAKLDDMMRKIKQKIAELEKYIGGDNDIKNTILLAPKEDRGILKELLLIKMKFLKKLRGVEAKKDQLLLEQGEELSKIRLKVRRTAHAGSTIKIGDRTITLNRAEQASKFHWDAEQCGIAITGL